MIDRATVAEVVTRLYTAAGRRFGEPELVLYAEALAQVDSDVALEASHRVVAVVDVGVRAPSPRLLLDYVAVIEAELRVRQPAIPDATGPVSSPDVARHGLADARGRLHGATS